MRYIAIGLLLLLQSAGFSAPANLVKVNAGSGILVCPNVALTSGLAVARDAAHIEVVGETDRARVLDRYEHVVRFGWTKRSVALVLLLLDHNLPFDASKLGLSSETGPPKDAMVGAKKIGAKLTSDGQLLSTSWNADASDGGAPLGKMTGGTFEVVAVLTQRTPHGSRFTSIAPYRGDRIGPVLKEWCGHPPGAEWLRNLPKRMENKLRYLKSLKKEKADAAVRCLARQLDPLRSLSRRMVDRPLPADYDRLAAIQDEASKCIEGSGETIPANLSFPDEPSGSENASSPASH